jgi:hypothetical protein
VKELMKRTFEMFAVDFFLQLGPDFKDYAEVFVKNGNYLKIRDLLSIALFNILGTHYLIHENCFAEVKIKSDHQLFLREN